MMLVNMRGIHDRYPHVYDVLKRYGFSPSKIIEILLDAIRGDKHAFNMIRIVRISRP